MITNRYRLILQTICVLILMIAILFSRVAYYSLPAQTVLLSSFIIIAIIWWILHLTHPAQWQSSPLSVGLFGLLIALVISSMLSLNPAQSWKVAWSWATAITLFIFTLFLLRIRLFTTKSILYSFIPILSIFAVATYSEVWQKWLAWNESSTINPFQIGLIHGWTESRNILVVLIVWLIIICFGSLWEQNRTKYLLAVWGILALPIIYLADSAGGYVAISSGCGSLVLIHCFPWMQNIWRQRTARQQLLAKSAVGLFLLGALLFGIRWLANDPGLGDRLNLWQIAWQAIRKNPGTGLGMGTYITSFISGTPQFILRPHLYFYTHNLWLNILADLGVLGLIAVLVIGVQLSSLLWTYRSKIQSPTVITIIACLVVFFSHTLIETPRPRIILIFFIFLASLVYELEPKSNSYTDNSKRQITVWFWPLFFTLLGINLWQNYQTQNLYEAGLSFAESGDWANAADQFDQAMATAWTSDTAVLYATAHAHAILDLSSDRGDVKTIYYERLISQEPAWPPNHLHLALLYQHAGNWPAAEQSFKNAAERAPKSAYIWLNWALFYEQTGQSEKANTLYSQIYQFPTTAHNSPFWQGRYPITPQACNSLDCFYFSQEALKTGWEQLAQGNNEQAQAIFEAYWKENKQRHDPTTYAGLFLTDSPYQEEINSTETTPITTNPLIAQSVLNLFLYPPHNSDSLIYQLNNTLVHTAQGYGFYDNGAYIKLGYLRQPLPHDFAPKCAMLHNRRFPRLAAKTIGIMVQSQRPR